MVLEIATALWIGVLTSISPCPLASNIAAISYIGRRLEKSEYVLLSGLLYTLGRVSAYIALVILLLNSVFLDYKLSQFLQKYMNMALGPILIIIGILLIEAFKFSFGGGIAVNEKFQKKIEGFGIAGSFILGIIFAMSFCPISAALFFGSLIPVAIKTHSIIMLPLLYGIGTALPVIGFAFIIALSAKSIGSAYKKVSVFAFWSKKITGALFIIIGLYMTAKYNLEIF